ncbi:DsbA family protein [Kitasatospora sp. NPDC051853]|uniref:DsbA family protein n=1 Tax=Kitasatospora sp. NPDC051853 TaxID=3364058 RepID=UPI0037ADD7E9
MSSNQQKKQNRSATDRMREQHAREQKAAKTRRRVVVGVSSALVLALVGGITAAVASSGSSSDTPTASGPLVVPANATGDGTVVTYGKADAPHTLKVYEDFRCPVCERLESSAGKTMQELADQGTYKIEYHFATFLDRNLGGKGSKTALNATAAALNEGVDKFKAFHDVLYANQPDESKDGFGSAEAMLNLADKVPGLKTDAFVKAVNEGTYLPWVSKVSKAFDDSGVSGTPAVLLDGKQLNVFPDNKVITGDAFKALVEQTTAAK